MSTRDQCRDVRAKFTKDVAAHKMSVIRDDGIHRHLRFKRPDSGIYWFDLITWPGALCIDGDVGTWVFRRLEDMFEFFRVNERDWSYDRDGGPSINPGYWAEKVAAASKYGEGATEFSVDIFREHVKEAFDEWVENNEPHQDAGPAEREAFAVTKLKLWVELEEQVIEVAMDRDEIWAHEAATAFRSEVIDGFKLDDAWEWRCQEFTFHYLWCCYAIAWGIKFYDQAKTVGHASGEVA